MIAKLVRTPGIYLVGFMGSGKTTVGRLLAGELGWSFADIDDDIEAAEKSTIADIFETRGEEVFRRLETEAIRGRLRSIERGQPHVVALGGGAFTREGNFRLVQGNGISVWLDCPLKLARSRIQRERPAGRPHSASGGSAAPRSAEETVAASFPQETHRPLARDPRRFAGLFRSRRSFYQRADFRVDASGDPATIVAMILRLPVF